MPFSNDFFFKLQSKEISFQLHEDLMKVLNELYTVSIVTYLAYLIQIPYQTTSVSSKWTFIN